MKNSTMERAFQIFLKNLPVGYLNKQSAHNYTLCAQQSLEIAKLFESAMHDDKQLPLPFPPEDEL